MSIMLKCDGDVVYGPLSTLTLCFQEKLLKICYKYLYLEPTQVVKEVSERTMVKELGKMIP